jgi:probable addiction module antidote protein
MPEKLKLFDAAEWLDSDEAIAYFMADAFETKDAGYIAHALGVVGRAKGMAKVAKNTGLSREQLYRSFSQNGNPTLKTTLAVLDALGLQLVAKVARADKARRKPGTRAPRVAPKAKRPYQRATKTTRRTAKP